MPIRNIFTPTAILAAALACGGLAAASHAAERYGPAPSAQWQPVFDLGDDDDDRAQTRDLRPTPGRPAARPRVTLRPSAPVVRIGTPINFELGSSVDGFAHVYVASASGRVQVWMENMPIAAGQHLLFPTRGSITAAPPAGREDIVLVVTRDRIKGFLGYGSTRAPRDLTVNPVAFKRAVRELFEDLPRRDWGYARTLVRVVNRPGSDKEWDADEWQ